MHKQNVLFINSFKTTTKL